MSNEYWKDFWKGHGRSSVDAPTQTQVLRTLNKQPIGDEVFANILGHVAAHLQLDGEDSLLDLCCGNGAITEFLAPRCRAVVGIDYSPELLRHLDTKRYPNVSVRAEDVDQAALREREFSRVLMYAGIQYFSEEQIVRLFCRVARALRPGGIFMLGDIPDADRLWAFFDSEERERAYFESLRTDKPIIGTWLRAEWLAKLGTYAGFARHNVVHQPPSFPYAHYRFDMTFRAP